MVDEFFTNSPWVNIFYQGPDGTLDYLVNQSDPSQVLELFASPQPVTPQRPSTPLISSAWAMPDR